MNIVEPIFIHCRNNPAEIALCAPGTEFNLVSYARLARLINNISRRIISLGLTAGMRVAIFIEDPILHALVVLAFTRLGIVTISGRTKEFSWRFEIHAVVADKSFSFRAAKIVLVDSGWTAGDGKDLERKYIYQGRADDVCRIILTSGTTGDEKAVPVTHRMMAARIDRQNLFFGRPAAFCTRTFCDLGLSTPLGFQVLIATLWRGGALFLTGDPQQTVNSLPIYKVQNMVASPSGLQALLEAAEARPEYQCNLQAVFCGGSILSNALSDRARARICANLTKGYGSTEATMVASMPAHFAPDVQGAVGRILPGIDVEIVDKQDAALRPGDEGIVRIRSEYGAKEYLNDPEETGRVFRNGWFYPGDLGYVTPDNMLVISGRAQAVINVAGEKVNPERVEEILSAHSSVQHAAVLATLNERGLDEICALVVPRAGSAMISEALQAFCRARLPSKFVPTRFVVVPDLPANEMGKIDRHKLPALLKTKQHEFWIFTEEQT
jgi:acyl-CoA synthetase (AMP-forming)/AMP-acid ligase II